MTLVSMKFESGLERVVSFQCTVTRKVDKSVAMEAVNDRGGRRGSRDETCRLGSKSLDDLDLAPHNWKRWVGLRHQ